MTFCLLTFGIVWLHTISILWKQYEMVRILEEILQIPIPFSSLHTGFKMIQMVTLTKRWKFLGGITELWIVTYMINIHPLYFVHHLIVWQFARFTSSSPSSKLPSVVWTPQEPRNRDVCTTPKTNSLRVQIWCDKILKT